MKQYTHWAGHFLIANKLSPKKKKKWEKERVRMGICDHRKFDSVFRMSLIYIGRFLVKTWTKWQPNHAATAYIAILVVCIWMICSTQEAKEMIRNILQNKHAIYIWPYTKFIWICRAFVHIFFFRVTKQNIFLFDSLIPCFFFNSAHEPRYHQC